MEYLHFYKHNNLLIKYCGTDIILYFIKNPIRYILIVWLFNFLVIKFLFKKKNNRPVKFGKIAINHQFKSSNNIIFTCSFLRIKLRNYKTGYCIDDKIYKRRQKHLTCMFALFTDSATTIYNFDMKYKIIRLITICHWHLNTSGYKDIKAKALQNLEDFILKTNEHQQIMFLRTRRRRRRVERERKSNIM